MTLNSESKTLENSTVKMILNRKPSDDFLGNKTLEPIITYRDFLKRPLLVQSHFCYLVPILNRSC